MPYKIHRENSDQAPVENATDFPGAHIRPETAQLATVETIEEARQMMQSMIDGGDPGDLYAVGFDRPSTEPHDG